MAKPVKDYLIDPVDGHPMMFLVYALKHKRFADDVSNIEGVESCVVTNTQNYLSIKISPLYNPQDVIDEIKTILKAAFAPIPDSFKDEFDKPL
jgi:hypothetical protein